MKNRDFQTFTQTIPPFLSCYHLKNSHSSVIAQVELSPSPKSNVISPLSLLHWVLICIAIFYVALYYIFVPFYHHSSQMAVPKFFIFVSLTAPNNQSHNTHLTYILWLNNCRMKGSGYFPHFGKIHRG